MLPTLMMLAACFASRHGAHTSVPDIDVLQEYPELAIFAQPWAFVEECTYLHAHPGVGLMLSNSRIMAARGVKLPEAGALIWLTRVWDDDRRRNRLLMIVGHATQNLGLDMRHSWLEVDCRRNRISIRELPPDLVPSTYKWSPSTAAYFHHGGRFISLSSCRDATSALCIDGAVSDVAEATKSSVRSPLSPFVLRPVATITSDTETAVLTDHDGQPAVGFVQHAWDSIGFSIDTAPLDSSQFAGSMARVKGARCRVRFVPNQPTGLSATYMAYCRDDSGEENLLVVGTFGFNNTGSLEIIGQPWEMRWSMSTGDPLLRVLVHPEAMAASDANAQWIVAQYEPEVGAATIACFRVDSSPIIRTIDVISPIAIHLIGGRLTVVDMHEERTFPCE